jgi:hypothetical protein
MIYFIGNKDLDICKIGYSKRPYRRIESLRKSVPFELEIYSIIEGSISEEKIYHSKYFEFKIKGEWFKLSKVEELGFNKNYIYEEYIGDIKLNVNKKNDYIHLQSLLAKLNNDRLFENLHNINFNSWKLSNSDFLETINTPIINEACCWINLHVAFELIRTSTTKNKIKLYEYLYPIGKKLLKHN